MRLYRFSPISTEQQLIEAIRYTHFACYSLCQHAISRYLPSAGNIGIFAHYDHEFELLRPIWKSLTEPSDNPAQKYFKLHDPIVIVARDDVPETVYTHLYIRRPDPYRYQVGDVDFYLEPEMFMKLKQQLLNGDIIPGARIFDRPDLDMIELYNPDIDALGYISIKSMTEQVRIKQSEITKL